MYIVFSRITMESMEAECTISQLAEKDSAIIQHYRQNENKNEWKNIQCQIINTISDKADITVKNITRDKKLFSAGKYYSLKFVCTY